MTTMLGAAGREGYPLSGRIEHFPFPNLLYRLHSREANGVLRVSVDGRENAVHFSDGLVAWVELMGEAIEPLGRILLELGKINDEVYQTSLVEMAKSNELHGHILKRMGAIGEAELELGLHAQLKRKLNRLFRLDVGRFDFHEEGSSEPKVAPLGTLPLIVNGIRSTYDEERLDRVLAPLMGLEVCLRDNFDDREEEYELRLSEKKFLGLMKEFKSVRDLVSGTYFPAIEAQMLLATLLYTEELEVQDECLAWKQSPRATGKRQPVAASGSGSSQAPRPDAHAEANARPAQTTSPAKDGPATAAEAEAVTAAADAANAKTSATYVKPPAQPKETDEPPMGTAIPRRRLASEILRRAVAKSQGGDQAKKPAAESSQDVEELLKQKEKHAEGSDYFALLEVDREADAKTLKKAYFRLAKRFHPDRFVFGELRALRRRAETVFERIGEAYETLRNPETRQEYFNLLSDERVRGDRRRAQMVNQAEAQFHRAEEAIYEGDFPRAEEFLKRAILLFKEDPDFHATLGWVVYKNPSTVPSARFASAIKHLLKALEIRAECQRAHLLLGRIYEQEGKTADAIRHYLRVNEQSRHHEAASALARLRPGSAGKR